MIDSFVSHAPTIGLLIFFTVFVVIAFWALKPSNRTKFQRYSEIPLLNEEHHG
jgi:cbb3-type cytochrome oxidase subunit 3